MEETLIKWIPLLPLLGFVLVGLIGKRMPRVAAGAVATASVAISFACAVVLFTRMMGLPPEARLINAPVFTWMTIPAALGQGHDLSLDVAFMLDPLSMTMTLIITGIGALIHLYAMGYMAEDERYSRFFSIMNLFVFFMLILVLAESFTLMFVGWEGVGLCSYLLIGFWWEDMANAAAGTKAFIVNRIGDFGFLLAMFWIFAVTGSLKFADVFAQVGTNPALMATTAMGVTVVTGITLLLFLGATGKSAQIPLYVWLPDAMAGPTPVSALIHAATMVTAGVYMIARCHPLFSVAPATQAVVAGIGAFTALMAATIAVAQFDMKKVLAYSTVSQLGYMFIGVGVGAYGAGVFHLMTHAFFKACLFLGAGAVMHALANNIDMRYMGNLKKYMPNTRWTYLIAVIAIAGIPPLAGFFSKDEVLAGAFNRGTGYYIGIGVVGLVTAFLTSWYMFRSYYMAFEGDERIDWASLKAAAEHGHGGHGHAAGDLEADHHRPAQVAEKDRAGLIHEYKGMSFVLWVLAIGSTVTGFLFGISALVPGLLENLRFENWLHPALSAWWNPAAQTVAAEAHHGPLSHMALAVISAAVAVAGWALAYMQHKARGLERAGLPAGVFGFFSNKWYVDDVYNAIFQRGGLALGVWLWQIFDARVIDGLVNGTASTVRGVGAGLRRWNTGFVRSYAFSILMGVVIVVGYLMYYALSRPEAVPLASLLGKGGY